MSKISPSLAPPRSMPQRGNMLVEFSVSISVFLVLVFATFDIVAVAYHMVTVQFVTARTLRQVVLGRVDPDDSSRRLPALNNDVINFTLNEAKHYSLPVTTQNILICAWGPGFTSASCNSGTAGSAGDRDDLVSVKIHYPMPILFGLLSHQIEGLAIGRNEHFN